MSSVLERQLAKARRWRRVSSLVGGHVVTAACAVLPELHSSDAFTVSAV